MSKLEHSDRVSKYLTLYFRPGKDDFWDGMTNPALSTSKEDVSEARSSETAAEAAREAGDTAASTVPLTAVVPEVSIQTRNHDIKGGQRQ